MMTKKNFIKIAKILKKNSVNEDLINNFCDYFKSENPNFDNDKFRKAVVN